MLRLVIIRYVLKIINKNNDLIVSLKAKCDEFLGRKLLGQGKGFPTFLDFERESRPPTPFVSVKD